MAKRSIKNGSCSVIREYGDRILDSDVLYSDNASTIGAGCEVCI